MVSMISSFVFLGLDFGRFPGQQQYRTNVRF
jgi:hypothetical protein